jgi:hypothetical protein
MDSPNSEEVLWGLGAWMKLASVDEKEVSLPDAPHFRFATACVSLLWSSLMRVSLASAASSQPN